MLNCIKRDHTQNRTLTQVKCHLTIYKVNIYTKTNAIIAQIITHVAIDQHFIQITSHSECMIYPNTKWHEFYNRAHIVLFRL